jgi:hypothetical protein
MDDFTGFRQTMQEMFARELGITMVPGLLNGPNTTFGETIGSLSFRRIQEDPSRVAEQQLYLVLRVYPPFSEAAVISMNAPYDPTPLEQLAAQIVDAIARNQTGLGAWFQRVTAFDFDPEDQGLQATIFAYSSNPGIAA